MKMKMKMKNEMILVPVNHMLFYVTYRSYTDDVRTSDDINLNQTMDDTRVDVHKSESLLNRLILDLNELHAIFMQQFNIKSPISENELFILQNSLMSGTFNFSPLRARESNSSETTVDATSMVDQFVIGALCSILIHELAKSSFFHQKCYSTYLKDDYFLLVDIIKEWRDLDSLLIVNCNHCVFKFSRSRLIDKILPILNYDDDFVKLISSFCSLQIIDDLGRDLSLKTGVPPMKMIAHILLNIILDDLDREIENKMPKLSFARYQDEILIPIFHKDQDQELYVYQIINEIFNEMYSFTPKAVRAVRGDKGIPFLSWNISINMDGRCQIE